MTKGGLYETMEEAKQAQAENGGLIVWDDLGGPEKGYLIYGIDNMHDIFEECDDDVIEYVFSHAEDGITFDELQDMMEKEKEERDGDKHVREDIAKHGEHWAGDWIRIVTREKLLEEHAEDEEDGEDDAWDEAEKERISLYPYWVGYGRDGELEPYRSLDDAMDAVYNDNEEERHGN